MFSSWLGKREPGQAGDSAIKLVAGLGNIGRKYVDTRHNVGFRVVEELYRRAGAGRPKAKFQGEVADARIRGVRVMLLTPHTLMNRSGASVLAARDFYKLDLEDVLIICDDFQLPLGGLRARHRGTAGGQNGLNDVIRRLGSQEIPRLRVGIGPPHEGWDVADFVLSKFDRGEASLIDETIIAAADATETWIADGMDSCMNKFNRTPKSEK